MARNRWPALIWIKAAELTARGAEDVRLAPQEQKALPHYVGPEIELDAEDVGSDGTPEAAG